MCDVVPAQLPRWILERGSDRTPGAPAGAAATANLGRSFSDRSRAFVQPPARTCSPPRERSPPAQCAPHLRRSSEHVAPPLTSPKVRIGAEATRPLLAQLQSLHVNADQADPPAVPLADALALATSLDADIFAENGDVIVAEPHQAVAGRLHVASAGDGVVAGSDAEAVTRSATRPASLPAKDCDSAEDAAEDSAAACDISTLQPAHCGGVPDDDARNEHSYVRLPPGATLLGADLLVRRSLGRGMFAEVYLCARPAASPSAAAVKVFRAHPLIRAQAQRELTYLRELAAADPADRCHLVRLRAALELSLNSNSNNVATSPAPSRLCLVFDRAECDLRQWTKQLGASLSSSSSSSRRVAAAPLCILSQLVYEMARALCALQSAQLTHGDLKPDNILLYRTLPSASPSPAYHFRLADFNSCVRWAELATASCDQLCSRYYRPPECLCAESLRHVVAANTLPSPSTASASPLGSAIDVWSFGCALFELFVGGRRVLFAGADENDMLRLQQRLRGALPRRLLAAPPRSHSAKPHHSAASFSARGEFLYRGVERMNFPTLSNVERQRALAREMALPSTSSPSASSSSSSSSTWHADAQLLVALLDGCLQLDPVQRLSPAALLAHPFAQLHRARATQLADEWARCGAALWSNGSQRNGRHANTNGDDGRTHQKTVVGVA